MASVIRLKTNTGIRYCVQLSSGENEKRPKIALGKVTKRQADTAKTNIENLVKCQNTGDVMPPTVQDWLNGVTDGLRKRLETLEIIKQRNGGQNFIVAEWTKRYIKSRTDIKDRTQDMLQNAANKLSAFFKGQYLGNITIQQAKDYRIYLLSVAGLAENTVRRQIGMARQFFNAAIDAGHISKNPFRGQSVTVRANPSRFFYITQEMAVKVLDACPDTQWRLIFGLARWGGLRCPSEILELTWQDIDFEHDRFVVHASKTAHHADGGARTVPMFPELRPLFQDAFDMANTGDVYCITRYRDNSTNLRTQMYKIISRAGLEPWPKIFQNLRSTRETELFKMTNGNVKAVCSWIGNSPAVAMQHYAQVTEADLQEAAKMTLISDAKKRVQNPVQTTAERCCTESHESNMDNDISPCLCDTNDNYAVSCEGMQNPQEYARQDSNLRPTD